MSEHVAALGSGGIEIVRPRLSVRRTYDPPRDAEGKIYCNHTDCQAAPPTFHWPCEWNKHMDKHERPYKCHEPGCNKAKGFTYTGGLLRHQREVHKQNNDTKKPFMCPYADCNRSTGKGFTRQENLGEHLRRCHMHTEAGPTASILVEMPSTSLKRRHNSPDRDLAGPHEYGDDLHNEVKRLRQKLQEKDRRLEQLERIVANLQQGICPPPTPEHDAHSRQATAPAPQITAPQP